MIRRLLVLLLLLLPIPAAAQGRLADSFLEGSWGLRVDGAIIMRFDLEKKPDGSWTGAWVKPSSFASDGQRFGNIKMPSVERQADSGKAIGEWAEITFNDPRPGEEPDQFRIRLTGADRAEMIYVRTGLPPFSLVRVADGALLGPFEEGKVYGSARPVQPGAAPSAQQPAVTGPPAPRPTSTAGAGTPAPRTTAPAATGTITPRAGTPSTAQQTTPPANAPVQGPPAMIGR